MTKCKKIDKEIFLENLPKINKSNKINWNKCSGEIVYFVYGDIKDNFTICSYDVKSKHIKLKYHNNYFTIKATSVLHGKLGSLFKSKNHSYIYKIGDNISDNSRNITITGRYKNKNNVRQYKYICNICGWVNGNITEYELKNGTKCSCCSSRTVVKGINDIATTAPWMIPYFKSKEESEKYTKCSNKSIIPMCPECKTLYNKEVNINVLFYNHGFSCPVCNDGYSYSEKFLYSFLKQLNIDFIMQFSSKNEKWIKKYRYDFGLPNYKCVLETHGRHHYETTKLSYKRRTLKEEVKNDQLKKELALLNGYSYYPIDCRESNLSWIKQSIINSKILKIFNCSEQDIDWIECDKFATSNRCKEVCNLKKENPNITAEDISKITLISKTTICSYLHKGTALGWCYYNKNGRKRILMLKDEKEIGVFDYVKKITQIEEYSNFSETSIQNVCRGYMDSYKGYKFIYI